MKRSIPPTKAIEFTKKQQEYIKNRALAMERIFTNAGVPVMQVSARRFLGRVISYSPVLTGRYVKSHRVGIDEKDTTAEGPLSVFQTNRKSVASSAFMTGLNKLKSAVNPKRIFISNSVHYAALVEFIGWKISRPYYTYTKAWISFRGEIAAIIKSYDNFLQEQINSISPKTSGAWKPPAPSKVLAEREKWVRKTGGKEPKT